MMPWNKSFFFPVAFGGDPQMHEWGATDVGQVMVGNIGYQARLQFGAYRAIRWLTKDDATVEVLLVLSSLTGFYCSFSFAILLGHVRSRRLTLDAYPTLHLNR
jgi:hypothetical protein